MASLNDAAQQIDHLKQQTASVLAGVSGAQDDADAVAGVLNSIGASNAGPVEAAVESLDTSRGGLKEFSEQLDQAQALLRQAMESTGLGGTSTAPAEASKPAESPLLTAGKSRWPGNYRVPDFSPGAANSECVEKIRRIGYPKNDAGNTSARGILYAPDGTQITDTLKAGNKGPAADVSDLNEPWATEAERMTIRYHVEGHVAAYMRRQKISRAVLYLNLPSCGERTAEDWRCHPNLPKVLPKGTKVRIWIIADGKEPRYMDYNGTGEALK
ncbi:DddA-like double-stranded DNA deaminase toxin [Salininema proteolyticum]|uniref:DddA-like double-stranded DNA deaminase toxin n=1 Tax=Salininema proteolyticum TaxID=1607685 RepID=A0ABV8TZR0_9ACTN